MESNFIQLKLEEKALRELNDVLEDATSKLKTICNTATNSDPWFEIKGLEGVTTKVRLYDLLYQIKKQTLAARKEEVVSREVTNFLASVASLQTQFEVLKELSESSNFGEQQ